MDAQTCVHFALKQSGLHKHTTVALKKLLVRNGCDFKKYLGGRGKREL